MIKNNFSNYSACELGRKISNRIIDPVELAEYFLELISNSPSLPRRSFTQLLKERTISESKKSSIRIKENRSLGPLDGVPCAWKDLFDVEGQVTAAGSKLLVNNTAKKDAIVLQKSRDSGLVFLGKTSTVEFALGGIGTNKHFPCPPNLSIPGGKHVAGGSSAGSASAVSGGLAPLAIGTDTGGSVRIPASWQGLVGLKTSHGLISLKGVVPLAQSLDTVGPLCKNVEDAYMFFKIATKQNFTIFTKKNIKDYKIIVCKNLVWNNCDEAVKEIIDIALHNLIKQGANLESAEIPEISNINNIIEDHGELVLKEAWNNWSSIIEGNEIDIDPNVLHRMHIGKNTNSKDINIVKRGIKLNQAALNAKFKKIDVIAMPTVCINPPLITEVKDKNKYNYYYRLALRNTNLSNILNLTSITIPIPVSRDQKPTGLMLCSLAGNEKKLLKLAKLCEEILNYSNK